MQKESPKEIDPILFFSPGRTGGSGLLHSLSCHPEVVACSAWPHEQRPIAYLANLGVSPSRVDPKNADSRTYSSVDRAILLNKWGTLRCTEFQTEDGVYDYEYRSYLRNILFPLRAAVRKASSDFYLEIASQQKKEARFYIEKTPFISARAMLDIFPKSRAIFLIRDPRDAVCSAIKFFGQKDSHKYFHDDEKPQIESVMKSYGQFWFKAARIIRSMRDLFPDLIVLKYEDMVSAPEDFFLGLLGALRLDFKGLPAVLEGYAAGLEQKDHRTTSDPKDSLGSWRAKLSQADAEYVQSQLADVCLELGY